MRLRLPSTLSRLAAHIRALPPSDRAIVTVLGGIIVVTAVLGLISLERSILVEQPAYGGSLHEGVVGSPRFVNPILAVSDTDRDLTALTYAGLMGYGPEGTLIPVLAESYEVTNNGSVYTFVIRKNAKFSDGTPVTADDVVFTIDKAQDPALKSPEYANWANIRAEAVDARTVRFTLPKAYAPFLSNTTLGILPAHIWKDVKDAEFPFAPHMINPIGAGPFVVSNVSRDKDGIVRGYDLRASSHYPLDRPFLNAMRFTVYDDEAALSTALQHGSVESGYGVAGPKGATTLTAPYGRVFAVFFNGTDNKALADNAVRSALSVAINRQSIVSDLLGGYGTALTGPVPPGSGIEVSSSTEPENRIGAAHAILEKAGWHYDQTGNSWSKKDKSGTQTLNVTLRTSNVPELKALAMSVAHDWQALGVPTSLELSAPNDLTQDVIRPRKYDALLFGMVVGQNQDFYAFWHSSQRADPGLNIAGYSNRQVDSLLEKLRTESDPAQAQQDLASVNSLIAADAPAAFIEAPDFLYVVPKSLQGVTLPQISSPSDRFATVATWYRNSEYVWPIFARKQPK